METPWWAYDISKSVTWGGGIPLLKFSFSASENSRIHSQLYAGSRKKKKTLGSHVVSGTGRGMLNNGVFECLDTNHQIR